MNILQGNILKIKNQGNISLVYIQKEEDIFTSLVIERPGSVAYLENGHKVNMHFKETEVILSKEKDLPTSLSNPFECIVDDIEKGMILSKIYLDYRTEKIHAVISTESLDRLHFKNGDRLYAFVKNNEIMLSS